MAAHPTCHVKVIKLKLEIIYTGGLPHLSGLPHLPGFPHLHVNMPLELAHVTGGIDLFNLFILFS